MGMGCRLFLGIQKARERTSFGETWLKSVYVISRTDTAGSLRHPEYSFTLCAARELFPRAEQVTCANGSAGG